MGAWLLQCLLFFLGLIFCSGTQIRVSDYGRNTGSSSYPEDLEKFQKQDQDHIGRRLTGLYIGQTSLDREFKQEKSGRKEQLFRSAHSELTGNEFGSIKNMPELDVVTPMTTVPTFNPTINPMNPGTIPVINPSTPPPPTYTTPITTPTTPVTTPITSPPVTSGQTWCIAIPTASPTALQVALDYACGYGGADCSTVQQGGSCYNPNTVRDHASYAFNNYYQKNPIQTSCDFGGTAMVTNTDPSTGTCIYATTSTSSTVLNTTNPIGSGSAAFGSEPPSYSGATSISPSLLIFFPLTNLLLSLISRDHL